MNDLISRSKAIRWVKAECNPYGQPTLDYESGIKVIEHLERMSSAQPEIIRCKDCKDYQADWEISHYPNRHFCATIDSTMPEDGFCSYAERKDNG